MGYMKMPKEETIRKFREDIERLEPTTREDQDDGHTPATSNTDLVELDEMEGIIETRTRMPMRDYVEQREAADTFYDILPKGGEDEIVILATNFIQAIRGGYQAGTPPLEHPDRRTIPGHTRHDDLSWISCSHHECELHLAKKAENGAFPVYNDG